MSGTGGAEKALGACAKAAAQAPGPIGAANPKRGSTGNLRRLLVAKYSWCQKGP